MSGYQGIIGLVILVLDIWAIVSTIGSVSTVGKKVLWVVLILILPLLGFILWLMMGPRARK